MPGAVSAAAGLVTVAMGLLLLAPPHAQAELSLTAQATNSNATQTTKAGTHPNRFLTTVSLGAGAKLRDLTIHLPAGFLINPSVTSECSAAAFATPRSGSDPGSLSGESCPNSSQIGVLHVDTGGTDRYFGLFSLFAPAGSAAAFAASPLGTPLVFRLQQRESDYGLDLVLTGVPESLDLRSVELDFWGAPWQGGGPPLGHDPERGNCLNEETGGGEGSCLAFGVVGAPDSQIKSFLTMPTLPCGTALQYSADALAWGGGAESAVKVGSILTNCNKPLTTPTVKLMTDAAAARTGLLFNLEVNDGGGILNPEGIARPPIKRAVLTLPEGLNINPSLGAGLGTCTEAQFASETATSEPGSGCPNAAKIGDVAADGILGLTEKLHGAIYLATPQSNRYGSLLSLYLLARSARRGLIVRSYGKLDLDPRTGRITATFDELPRMLYTKLSITLREGQRSTMVSPPACGAYTADLDFSSWVEPDTYKTASSLFLINRSADGSPCPDPGRLPFAPGLLAGTLSPTAGAYTPLYLRMTRTDPEQEITSYSATLPPGLLGKIAGRGTCSDAAIEAARTRSGFAELAQPSCPDSAKIGHTLAGYGVGGVLAYAPGNLYLAGPYHGAPLSTVALDAATIGPFDLGTVVVRSAIRVDPTTAQVQIDSAGSDPIPHILGGIPLRLRDIRVYLDAPQFTKNPTSCDPSAFSSLLTGAAADLFGPADDTRATSTQRFALLGCSALGFRPKLRFALRSKPHSAFPALRTEYTPRPADANTRFVSVTLPRSLFVAQSHLRNICTRVQFSAAAGNGEMCPADSVYGRARAFTPLLDSPLEGNVYLRSATPLPNMVFALRGPGGLAINVVGTIDTVHGATRATFTEIPDAPLAKFVLSLDGGRGSLLEAANDACDFPQYANARAIAHNNLGAASKPRAAFKCAKSKTKKKTAAK